MRRRLAFLALAGAFFAAAWLGWWAIPATAALWGALRPPFKSPALMAAAAAGLAWASWLAVNAVAGRGAFGTLLQRLTALFELPALVLVVVTLVFASLLAWSAAAVVGGIAGYWGRGDGN